MVYIYEELSEGLHSYRAPNPGTSINITRYVSNGYVVLMPDIVYETGYPGESAEKCVIPAVNTVVAQGFIDPKRIGIQGHSWGGYQITHLITRTNMFAAVQAGASVSDMVSAYGGIRWGTGMSRAFQYQKTQSRIGLPPWDAPLQFIENSPIFWVEKVHTPYLSIHNDEDDAVPWYQGIEFFSAMRRLGKEAYMFVYNGEPHGLRQRDNMKHWTVHQDEFFDHFLLGKPTPEWMQKGVPYPREGPARRFRYVQAQGHDGADAGAGQIVLKVRIRRLDPSVELPAYGTDGSAAFDLAASETTVIAPGEVRLVPTGLVIEVPAGMFLGVFARSSTPLKRGLMVANGVGVVDSDYCGPSDEIKVPTLNFTAAPVTVAKGDRIAQGILLPSPRVEWDEVGELREGSRGGFGATGS